MMPTIGPDIVGGSGHAGIGAAVATTSPSTAGIAESAENGAVSARFDPENTQKNTATAATTRENEK